MTAAVRAASNERKQRVKELFELCDQDSDGLLNRDELAPVLAFNLDLQPNEVTITMRWHRTTPCFAYTPPANSNSARFAPTGR